MGTKYCKLEKNQKNLKKNPKKNFIFYPVFIMENFRKKFEKIEKNQTKKRNFFVIFYGKNFVTFFSAKFLRKIYCIFLFTKYIKINKQKNPEKKIQKNSFYCLGDLYFGFCGF